MSIEERQKQIIKITRSVGSFVGVNNEACSDATKNRSAGIVIPLRVYR